MPGRVHSSAFKLDIVRQVEAGGKSKAQLCREHDLSPAMVFRWQQQYDQHGETAFEKGHQEVKHKRWSGVSPN